MNKQNFLLLVLFSVVPYALFAQMGRISGTIKDERTNAVLTGVSVTTVGGTHAMSSDFEGDYTLEVAPGTYTVLFSYVGYVGKEITEIKVEAGKAATVDVTLTPSADQLEEVVVSVSVRKNTEQSILNMQKNAGVVMDGLSAQSIQRAGASNIASAMRVVPGVSVQDGKYLYVRGLGDRYTKSILNGVDIPGLDPDKNTVQMDIFPTGVLENIVVLKSASAEYPADFTGGVVDIVTKDIPAQKQMGVSLSLGYNPDMHFQDNYVSGSSSGTDFLGFDNGMRSLPISKNLDIPTPTSANGRETLEGITRSFDPEMAAYRKNNALPDLSLGFNYSNQYNLWGNKLGLIGVLNYKRTTSFYEGFENGIYQKPNQSSSSSELRPDRVSVGDMGMEDVLLSGLLGLNYKTDRSKYTFNVLHVQNGESRSSILTQRNLIKNDDTRWKHILEYGQRSISNILLSGKHSNESADFITEWKISPSLARVQDKDIRETTFEIKPTGEYAIGSGTRLPTRIWRDLTEFDGVATLDFTKQLNWFERVSSFKFGGRYTYKQRDYGIYLYDIDARGGFSRLDLNGDPNAILADGNIWNTETNLGSFIQGEPEPANIFDASQHTAAAYASTEFRPLEKLKAVVGVRAEQYTTFFTGENVTNEVYNNRKTINKFDLFPSLNLIYSPYTNHNLRASYSRTTARPSFKELSVVQIYDPLTDTRFLGNLDLKPAYIDNMDLRYEIFADNAQMVAVSGFYKRFTDPIEIQSYDDAKPDNIIARNAPMANVYGLEVEGRKNFDFISDDLRNLSLNVNVTIVRSEIEMNENEYNSRVSFAREGQTIDRNRELQGQSPYLVNAGLNYNNVDNGWEAGVFYNVQGKTLEIIGFSQNSDVYTKPFHNLNLNLTKRLGREFRGGAINIKAENILDSKRLSVYEAYMAADQTYSLRAPRRTFTIGYSYNF